MKKPLIVLVLLITSIAIVSAEKWAGADDMAEDAINKINPDYQPWFSPVFEPPSSEIESMLFSLQAAFGALIIGYFLGYYRGLNHA
ncbi:energy-coupling factor ABC transporter substrate-binding protein [Archaeoglobus neptunius]|uniref:energy-coupling factor ABC transporter substrate-binding protein n=1 Tax=Archaeoglobus neptunius TaxID=2798580 RepID=UPI001925E91C|nr:energy-coupling factor ABC transporter substrate-binding protein [Archaeoglobus neptunius]